MLLVGPTTNCVLMSAAADFSTITTPITVTFSANAGTLLPSQGSLTQAHISRPIIMRASMAQLKPFPIRRCLSVHITQIWAYLRAFPPTELGIYTLRTIPRVIRGQFPTAETLAITTITPVNQVADLAAAIAASSNQVILGGVITNTWTITDNGPDAVSNVYVTNILSTGLTLSTNLLPSGAVTVQTGSTSIYNLGNLAAGGSVVVTNIVVASADGLQTNLISTGCSVQDANPGNNAASVVTTVNPPPVDLILRPISVTPNPVVLGGSLVYTVGVTNNGPDTAFNVVGTFSLSGLQFGYAVLFPSAGTSYSVSGNSLTCNLGTIAAGSNAEVTIAATAIATGILTNVWTVTTTSANTNLANSSVASHVTVTAPMPVITNGSATLVSQGGPPFNGAINNNQTNTVSFTLLNIGTGTTTNLVATLVANSGVRPITTSQNTARLPPAVPRRDLLHLSRAAAPGPSLRRNCHCRTEAIQTWGPAFYSFALPATLSFSNTGAITIPYLGAASPYPSSIEVTAPANVAVSQAVATLKGFTHSWPSDVEAVLAGTAGQEVMLMEHTGAFYSVTNLTLTFSTAATQSLPLDTTLFSGAFWPTENSPFDSLPAVGAVPANSTNLTVFNGTDPSGIWSLYVYDDSQGNNGVIAGGWSLNLTTISAVAVMPTLSAAKMSSQTLQLTVSGSTALSYGIQVSTNLDSWTTVATNAGNFTYTDSFTNGPHRFYRAVQLSP